MIRASFARVLALLALGTLGALDSACADVAGIPDARPYEPGTVCPGSIPIKLLADLSGPTSDVGVPYFKGENDLIREINATGGIRGCTLDVESVDYAYDQAGAVETYGKWKTAPEWPRVAAILGWGSGDTIKLAPIVRDDHKPFISASYAGALASPEPVTMRVDEPRLVDAFKVQVFPSKVETDGYPYNFFAGTDYSTAARIAMFYVDGQAGKRVGFAYCSKNAYCTEPIKAVHTHAKALDIALGRDLVLELDQDEATYRAAVLDYFQKELDHQRADPNYKMVDWLWMGNTVKTTIYLAKALDAVKRQLDVDVQIIVNAWGLDESVYATCGAACVGRVHGVMPFVAWGDKRAPEMAKVMALHDKYREIDGDPPHAFESVRYVQGYASVLVLKTAIERVLATGKPVNGKNVRAALETFHNVELGGLCDRITFDAKDHRPQSNAFIYKIVSGGTLVNEPPDRKISMEQEWLGW